MSETTTTPTIDYPRCPPSDHRKWIMHVPVISTGHIDKEVMARLASDGPSFLIGEIMGNDGLLLSLDDLEAIDEDYGADLFLLLTTFSNLGYCYLRLDPDGDDIEGLKSFDW